MVIESSPYICWVATSQLVMAEACPPSAAVMAAACTRLIWCSISCSTEHSKECCESQQSLLADALELCAGAKATHSHSIMLPTLCCEFQTISAVCHAPSVPVLIVTRNEHWAINSLLL